MIRSKGCNMVGHLTLHDVRLHNRILRYIMLSYNT
jgi:hypothetical protein